MRGNKPPMTREEAQENVAEMMRHTPRDAMRRLLQLALGPLGNLSDDARDVYRAALAKL